MHLNNILEEYQDLFTDELGTIKPFKANLAVDPSSILQTQICAICHEGCCGRRVGLIGKNEGIDHSEWAAPIVADPKKDGCVRLRGDYKVTVNPALDIDQYSLPRPTDLFATLASGKYFTTLDLSHAYNQIQLDKDSKKYLTINTHCGLYRHTRLSFGVASVPALFQKSMDVVLQGLDGVIC